VNALRIEPIPSFPDTLSNQVGQDSGPDSQPVTKLAQDYY
jgi:hypothetical protein